jgi:serine/threonine protein kinase/tetratricopeptide (TPR) repeat protein
MAPQVFSIPCAFRRRITLEGRRAKPMNELDLFATAIAIADPVERNALLDRECAGNADLRAKLDKLLDAHFRSNPLLDQPTGERTIDPPNKGGTVDHVAAAQVEGAMIAGRYKLLQQVGEGGMGTVWMAEQTQPVKRRVAVKLIRTERGTAKTILSRFEAERQAIALMDHPNIAKLLDAGEIPPTQAGGPPTPYFVMELVKGIPLNQFCDAHKLSITERLAMFQQICSAAQHAHQKGIIHRDLKPSNILVENHDGKPVPKIIDFGLAKATTGLQLTERTLVTAFGSVMGTPQYMAPEQANFHAVDVDTRADIYALGVILYELLTGTTPITPETVKNAALDEVLRLIREQEAPTPSSRLSTSESRPGIAATRHTEPAQLTKLVKGDLDWIVMKALSKERDRRYETANGFALDIQRYLANEPVLAGPPSVVYRVRKFVRRNRGKVLAAAVVLLASLGGLGAIAAVQRAANLRLESKNDELTKANERVTNANTALEAANARVRAQYSLAVDAIKTYHTGVSEDFLLKEEKFKDLRDRLLSSASDFYVKLGAILDKETDLGSRRALAQANFEVAALTGTVGRKEAAIAAHRLVLASRQVVAAEPVADAETKAEVGRSLSAIASLLESIGKTDEALATYRKAETLLADLVGSTPTAVQIRAALAGCRSRLGYLLYATGNGTEGLRVLRQARSDQEVLAGAAGSTMADRRDLSETIMSIGRLLGETGRPGEAEAEYRAALAIRQKLADENPTDANLQSRLAQTHNNLGFLLALTGRSTEAEAEHRKALAIRQKLADDHPAVTDFRKFLGHSLQNLGLLLSQAGRLSEADVELRKGLALFQKLADDNPAVTDFRGNLADIHQLLGMILWQTGRLAEAEAEFRSGVALYLKLADDHPAITEFRSHLADSYDGLGVALQGMGKSAEAVAEFHKGQALLQRLADDNPAVTGFRSRLANSHTNLGTQLADLAQTAEAEAEFRKALALCRKLVEDNPALTESRVVLAVSHQELGKLLAVMGRSAEAEAEYRRSLAICQALVDANPNVPDYRYYLALTLGALGDVNRRLGRSAEVHKVYARALATSEALVKENPKTASYRSALAFLLRRRGLARRDMGDPTGTAADAQRALELYEGLPSRKGEELFETACCHAVLSMLAGREGSGIPVTDGPPESAKAIEILSAAIKQGYRNPYAYRGETALDPLRKRDDFKKLLAELEKSLEKK